MKNVTISIKDSVAAFIRVHAAAQDKSVSAFIGQFLEELMDRSSARRDALEEFLSEEPYLSTRGWKFDRDEIHRR